MESAVLVISLCVLFVAFLSTLLGYLYYCGLFRSIQVKAGKPPFKNITIAYKFARGPYKNAGRLFTEVHSLDPQVRTIGIYYDDPDQVDSQKLRSLVGAVLSDGDDTADQSVFSLFKDRGYKFVSLPEVDNVVYANFPFTGSLSVIIGVFKAYPLLREYVSERNLCAHPAIEVYDGKFIHFVLPLSKQDEFYVPESSEDSSETCKPSEAVITTGDTYEATPAMTSVAESETSPIAREHAEVAISQGSEVPVSETPREISSTSVTNGDNDSDKSTTSSFEELQLDAES